MSGTFPTHHWDPGSRTGYRTNHEVRRTRTGAPYIVAGSDRPRRYWEGTLNHLSDAEWTTIWSLFTTNQGTYEHDTFSLTDPWNGDSYTCVFTAPPQRVLRFTGAWTVTVRMEESASSTRAAGVTANYPTVGQSRGSREIKVSLADLRYPAYGGLTVFNTETATPRMFEIVHDPISQADLDSLMDHYEADWSNSFTLGEFDATGETSITVRYARPPEIGQVAGVFRVSNQLEAF